VVKWFSFLLRVTCVIFARAINTDVWQAMVARATSLRKTPGVLPYMGYIGICGPKGYGFSAVLVINEVSNFGHFGHKYGLIFAL